jgi:hypothetical protein
VATHGNQTVVVTPGGRATWTRYAP